MEEINIMKFLLEFANKSNVIIREDSMSVVTSFLNESEYITESDIIEIGRYIVEDVNYKIKLVHEQYLESANNIINEAKRLLTEDPLGSNLPKESKIKAIWDSAKKKLASLKKWFLEKVAKIKEIGGKNWKKAKDLATAQYKKAASGIRVARDKSIAGVKAASKGIARGARAAGGGVARGAKSASKGIARGARATGGGVARGARATGRGLKSVYGKMGTKSKVAAGIAGGAAAGYGFKKYLDRKKAAEKSLR
jgi:hypothetical protein